MKKPTVLVIMDGFGLAEASPDNAVSVAKTPNLDRIFGSCPHTRLSASGLDVGLPDGQMGNSEVGHTNIGAGRVVFQDLPRISLAIEKGDFFENPAYNGAIDHCLKNGASLHLMGLMSDGGVHSHNTHVWAMLELCRRRGLDRVILHCFLDGRDVSPTSGKDFVAEAGAKCAAITGRIGAIMGRYYAMDRDKRWDRVARAYNALVFGDGAPVVDDPPAAISRSYESGVTDEFLEPIFASADSTVKPDDAVIFYNFRPDRAREITRAFVDPDFDGFERRGGFFPLKYVCTTQYDAQMPNVSAAFAPEELTNIFGEYIASKGLTQLRIAETEKYAHVTFFFNGGEERVFEGEARALIPSPKVATYDLKPEMSAFEVAEEAVARVKSGKYDVVVLNFANCDMVGHTGVFEAAVTAVETVDTCVGRVIDAVAAMGGVALITADHGNAEKMRDQNGGVFTAHTTNPVPFALFGADAGVGLKPGRLCDIAPTMLDLLGLGKPAGMTGTSLLSN
ncbi:MAG: 2,3-bisphosphoglycerate-independent phosphoglycerate mutase [Oscillospiraceae bacterium]|nr:2,3-bisphosphoglycerate-independent phosphoglycerate mutase [Oscillospiraceae bacterium]